MKSRSFLEHRDTFTFRVTVNEKPFTRRVVLSTINGLYNPLGFALPVNIAGKLLLREAMNQPVEWDQLLPEEFRNKFQLWKHDIGSLEGVNIPRTYSMEASSNRDLFIYTDASELAIAAVAYIVTIDNSSKRHFGFVLGKAKVAPGPSLVSSCVLLFWEHNFITSSDMSLVRGQKLPVKLAEEKSTLNDGPYCSLVSLYALCILNCWRRCCLPVSSMLLDDFVQREGK